MATKRSKKAESLVVAEPDPKKPKTGDGQLDEQCTHCPYNTADLWQKLGFYVQKEIFCYIDIRVSNKFCRVSKSWKSQLVGTKGMNNGIAFLDWRVEKKTRVRMNKRFGRAAQWPWRAFFQLDFSGITNLVSIGPNFTTAHYTKTGKVFAVKKPLEKLTFWGGNFGHLQVIQAAGPLQAKGILLQFLKCEMRARPDYFTFSEYHLGYLAELPLRIMSWYIILSPVRLEFDETFQQAKGEQEQVSWLFKKYDEMNLIWPYGEDQVEWLRMSIPLLMTMKEDVLDAVQMYQRQFEYWSSRLGNGFKKLKIKNSLSRWNVERELNTLECAFLGRVISKIPEDKRPQSWAPPPYPFSSDHGISWASPPRATAVSSAS